MNIESLTILLIPAKVAGNGLQRFSNSYTLKDENFHCLTSDSTLMESSKCPIIDKQVAVILFI